AVALADGELRKLDLVGTPAKEFPADARDLDGKPVSLAEYRGKLVLVDFWATWCAPCRAEMPNVLAASERWREKGFEVVGVTIDAAGDGAKVREFVQAKGIPWRQVHYANAPSNAVAALYGVHGVPHTVLVGRDGRILRVGLRG